MRKMVNLSSSEIEPQTDAVFQAQGIPKNAELPKKVLALFHDAMNMFRNLSHPRGMLADISVSEFGTIYQGEGLNELITPLDSIYRKADDLAMFAATIGDEITQKITELFKTDDFALGTMLDFVASEAADNTADMLEKHFDKLLSVKPRTNNSSGILRYSPGYCGWHISGQKKLFEFLHPEEISIQLLPSYLMKPLKSVTGLIVSGNKQIHIFKDDFPFCTQCRTHSCRDRIKNLILEKTEIQER